MAITGSRRERLQTVTYPALVAVCTALLTLPALLNGAPFIYFDSGAYLEHADRALQFLSRGASTPENPAFPWGSRGRLGTDDDLVIGGRSIYYSGFVAAGTAVLGLAAVPVAQALVLASLLVAAFRVARPGAPTVVTAATAVLTSAVLALLSSAGFFASLIMPDLWAGMMILAVALLFASPSPPTLAARLLLGGVMALAVLFHTSHLLLLSAMTVLLAVARVRSAWRERVAWGRLLVPAAAVACGLAGQVAFAAAVKAVTGRPPVTRPFVTAHLVELGPGTRLIQATCPDSGFALCPYADRLPTDWISFLFETDARRGVFQAVPPEVQRALAEEQGRFALATLRSEPFATLGGVARDGVAQLWHLSVDDVPLTAANAGFVRSSFSSEVEAALRASSIWARPWFAPALTRLIQVGTAAAAVALVALALVGRLPRAGPAATIVALCLLGWVLNGLICGALASPYGRFQARVAWLLPLALALAAPFAPSLRRPLGPLADGSGTPGRLGPPGRPPEAPDVSNSLPRPAAAASPSAT